MKFTAKKKGFTIVELVIVIAVIAILAAVLIPTFSGVVAKANESSAKQIASNAIKSALLMTDIATLPDGTFVIVDSNSDAGSKFDYGYKYTGNTIDGPKDLYDGDGIFYSALLTNGAAGEDNKLLNTVLVKPDHIVKTVTPAQGETPETTTYSVDALFADMLVVACGGTSRADNTANVTVTYDAGNQNYTLTVTVGENVRVFTCFTSVDFAKNVIVFTIM